MIKGIDFKLHDDPAAYRAAVEFIRDDPLSMGALVTTHKNRSLCRLQGTSSTSIDPHASLMGGDQLHLQTGTAKLICHCQGPHLVRPVDRWVFSAKGISGRTAPNSFPMGAGGFHHPPSPGI